MSLGPTTRWFSVENHERQSLEALHSSLDDQLPAFQKALDILQESLISFQKEDIHPYHCRKALQDLRAFRASINSICQLLKDNATLPVMMLALRYQLLDQLHYLEERIDQSADLVYTFISSCIHPSSQTAFQLQKIRDLFQELVDLGTDIPSQPRFLIDEAHFQEKRLLCNLTEQ